MYGPAASDDVLTVSALADYDGLPGAGAAPTFRTDQDDALADLANRRNGRRSRGAWRVHLRDVPLEAGGGTISGTSMASPHAAGASALLASAGDPGNATDVDAL